MADVFSGRGSRQIPPFRRRQSSFSDFDLRGDFPAPFQAGRTVRDEPGGRGFGASPFFQRDSTPGPFSGQTGPNLPFSLTEDERAGQFAADPGFAFNTAVTQAGLPRNQVDFFRGRASEFLNRFQGALGNELDKFGTQNLNPLDFFRDQVSNQEFLRFSPSERGANAAGLNRASRILF